MTTSSCGPVFLVGAQRSGTTALAYGLSEAFAAAGGSFTVNGKLPYLLRRWWTTDDLRAQHLRSDEVVHALGRLPPGGVDSGDWLDRAACALAGAAQRAAEGRVVRIEEEVRRVCAEVYGPAAWGDKYNEYLLDLPWLDRCFPTARWLFIVAEPGVVVSSMLAWTRGKDWNPTQARAAARKWATWNGAWLRFRGSIPPARRFELGYEHVNEAAKDRLADWLGLEATRFLSDYQPRRGREPVSDLPSEAMAVRRELAELGLLTPDGGEGAHGSAPSQDTHALGADRPVDATFAQIHHVLVAMPRGEEATARRFYAGALGLQEVPKPPVLALRGGCWFKGHGVEFHVGVEDDFRPARVAHPAFLMRGLDELGARLDADGVAVRWDPNYPGYRRFYAHDPFGNRLEFLEPASSDGGALR